MTAKGNAIPLEQFVTLWNTAESLDEATKQVQAIAGRLPQRRVSVP